MSKAWERAVSRFLTFRFSLDVRPPLCTMGIIACGLVLYREVRGPGRRSGMNDAMPGNLEDLQHHGSDRPGSRRVYPSASRRGIFGRPFASVMRTAVISSFLVYASGLMLLGIDVAGRGTFFGYLPHGDERAFSMLEVGFCMPLYTAVPLFLSNPARAGVGSQPLAGVESTAEMAEGLLKRIYPWVLGLAFLLPAMHQSSLAHSCFWPGNQVHPLWQTPCLPLLYVWAASFMGFAFVSVVLMICHLIWNRPLTWMCCAK